MSRLKLLKETWFQFESTLRVWQFEETEIFHFGIGRIAVKWMTMNKVSYAVLLDTRTAFMLLVSSLYCTGHSERLRAACTFWNGNGTWYVRILRNSIWVHALLSAGYSSWHINLRWCNLWLSLHLFLFLFWYCLSSHAPNIIIFKISSREIIDTIKLDRPVG